MLEYKIPNFFIVGAPKTGTTSLVNYLEMHPNVFMTKPKEPNFFSLDLRISKPDPLVERNKLSIEKYLELYRGATTEHKVIGEATTNYIYSAEAPKSIYKLNPKAKILIMIRNPIDLIYSYHSQKCYNLEETETDFYKAWKLCESRKNGQMLPNGADTPLLYNYEEIGKLGKYIENYLDIFPRSNVYILNFDRFICDTEIEFKKILDFLELENIKIEKFKALNQNKTYRNAFLAYILKKQLVKHRRKLYKLKKILKIENTGMIKAIEEFNKKSQKRVELDPKFRNTLKIFFSKDIEKIENITGFDLKAWK